jgi:hypothetical protein
MLRLDDFGAVRIKYQQKDREAVVRLLPRLRAYGPELADLLCHRTELPPMPEGVRLLKWELQRPPVILTRWSVVNDVSQFARSTLQELQAALSGENWRAGNWSVAELTERLRRVGVEVEICDLTP